MLRDAEVVRMVHQHWKEEFEKILEGSTLGSSRFEEAITFKQQYLPKRIYKYRKDCPESRDCLETNSVWMASPDSYNDPYDCSIMLPSATLKKLLEARLVKKIVQAHNLQNHLSPEQIEEALKSSEPLQTIVGYFPSLPGAQQGGNWSNKAAFFSTAVSQLANAATTTIAEWRKFAKICSFSEVSDSILMWSHYADHHRGFCVEYDLEALSDPNHFFRRNLYPVLYSSDFYDLGPFVQGLSDGPETRAEFQPMLPLLSMLTKFDGWGYEQEWRLFQENAGVATDGKKESPVPARVFLGERSETLPGNPLVNICKKKQIPLSRMRLAKDKFQLIAQDFKE
jgi:hypothetical protein